MTQRAGRRVRSQDILRDVFLIEDRSGYKVRFVLDYVVEHDDEVTVFVPRDAEADMKERALGFLGVQFDRVTTNRIDRSLPFLMDGTAVIITTRRDVFRIVDELTEQYTFSISWPHAPRRGAAAFGACVIPAATGLFARSQAGSP